MDHNGSPGKPSTLCFFSDLKIVQFVLTLAKLHIFFQIHNIEYVCRLLTDKQITYAYNMQSAVRSSNPFYQSVNLYTQTDNTPV